MKIIKNDVEYKQALEDVDKLFNANVKKNTFEGDQLELLLLVIKDYEDKNYKIPHPNVIEVIKLKMKEMGVKNSDLVPFIGNKSYVSQILNNRKPLTVNMIKMFYQKFDIPASILLA